MLEEKLNILVLGMVSFKMSKVTIVVKNLKVYYKFDIESVLKKSSYMSSSISVIQFLAYFPNKSML